MKCNNCNNTATVHLTEIKGGKKIEKHLCEQCAAENEGLPVKSHMPINELLTQDFPPADIRELLDLREYAWRSLSKNA